MAVSAIYRFAPTLKPFHFFAACSLSALLGTSAALAAAVEPPVAAPIANHPLKEPQSEAPGVAHSKKKAKGQGSHGKKHATAQRNAAGPRYATRKDAMQAADEMAQKLQLDRTWVRHVVGEARYLPGVAKAVLPPPPGVAKNWAAYRDRFIEPRRIEAGVRFWQANQDALNRAEQQFGVPPSIVVGIVGVESFYGRDTGNYRIADALSTLTFDFPAAHPKAQTRAAYFRSELEAFLALTSRTHTDPLALRGSYAGAMGWPQFMPSSWTQYAIDFDGDGRVDLFNSQADMIGSVAHYFQAFHWKPGAPTHFPADMAAVSTEALAKLQQPDILPSFSAAEMEQQGVQLNAEGARYDAPLALIALQNGDAAPTWIAGTENFYVITRYNWSAYYAMAVIELGQAVAKARVTSGIPQATMPK